MRYVKFVILAFVLLALPATTFVSALADEAPAAPPAAEPPKEAEKPAEADIQPAGGAFDTLKKLQAAGCDKLYYIIIRNFEMVGWAKSELAVGVWENQPVIEQTLATSFTDSVFRQETKTEGKIYYNANLEVQGLTESVTRQNQTTTIKATRAGKALEVETTAGGGEAKQSEVIVEGLPDPPVNIYALVLRYFDGGMKDDTTITILNDNNLAAFTTATAQPLNKLTAITEDTRLVRCLAYAPDGANRFALDSRSGIVARKDIALNMQASSAQFIIDKATFDNWVVNGKWNEAAKAIAQNVATLLPPPSKPIPDWNAKRAELEKHWKELADKIPADMLNDIKAFVPTITMVDPKNITQEQKDKLAKYGDNVTYYFLAQALNDADQAAAQMRWNLARPLTILFPGEIPPEIRDSLLSTFYDELHAPDVTYLPAFLAERAWCPDTEDVFIDRIKNSKGEAVVTSLESAALRKQAPWADALGLYMLTNNMGWNFGAVTSYMGNAAQKPLYIGLLLERCRLGVANNPDMWAAQTLDAILGQKEENRDFVAFYNEFYCKWDAALFSYGTVPDDVKAKANDLFTKLDAEDLATRESAKKDLVAMGKVILPLLEAQRNNNSPEVRAAVSEISDLVVAPGYSTTVDFIRKNQYDRNLSIFIGYLACQTPSTRAKGAERLKALTGQDFGEDLAKWHQWHQTNKDSLKWNKDKNMWTVE